MGKTFTAIGIVQEVNVEGDEAVIIAYDTRASKMRAIRILKKDFDKYFIGNLADGAKLEMVISQKTDEVERINQIVRNWISTIKGKADISTEYNYRHDYA